MIRNPRKEEAGRRRGGDQGRACCGGRIAFAGLGIGLLVATTGCLHRRHHRQQPPSPPPSPLPSAAPPKLSGPGITGITPPGEIVQAEEGIASWYGYPYHGRHTSNGEIYNMYGLTAAHRTLPFNTKVRVHDLENGRTVEVRINDRGPFIEGRIIDLSYAAAQAIKMVGPGSALVRLEILNPSMVAGPGAVPGVFGVQVGSFRDQDNAQRLKQRITAAGFSRVTIQTFDRGEAVFYRVRVGSEGTQEGARLLGVRLKNGSLATEVFIVRLN